MTVTANDVRAAAKRLKGHVVPTPLVDAPMLSATLGCEVKLKLENLQHCLLYTSPSPRDNR